MEIKRDFYLNKLIRKKWNGQVKIITGLRRAGKSYLLFGLFYRHLIESGVSKDNIITLALDLLENIEYRDPIKLYDYLNKKIINSNEKYYILLDELQYAISKKEASSDEPLLIYSVLSSLINKGNVDVYITGSNSRFLSSDVMTQFRGRGDQIIVYPLSFKEFYQAKANISQNEALQEYFLYGGLPFITSLNTNEDKEEYLTNLVNQVYINDIIERYDLKGDEVIDALFNILASTIGSLTNPNKLVNTFNSNKIKTTAKTINNYLDMLIDSFLITKANRFDIMGKEYISTPFKYYFEDLGIRNAKIGFRQYEETHIMENVIYNELLIRGFKVDVGVVKVDTKDKNGKHLRANLEVDFVVNKASKKYYIQAAYALPTKEKQEQEEASLDRISSISDIDNSKRIIITKEGPRPYYNTKGYLIMNIYDFLLNENSLDY